MPQFSRKTVIAAVALLERSGHSDITRFLLEHGLEGTPADIGGSRSHPSGSHPGLSDEDDCTFRLHLVLLVSRLLLQRLRGRGQREVSS